METSLSGPTPGELLYHDTTVTVMPSTDTAANTITATATDVNPSKNNSATTTATVISPTIFNSSPLATLTTSISRAYIERAAHVSALAGLTDPFSILLQIERRRLPASQIQFHHLYEANIQRLNRKTSNGGFIAEAADWAAMACWEDGEASLFEHDEVWGGLDVRDRVPDGHDRPIFVDFLNKTAAGKRSVFPKGQKYWHLSLMARDPSRTDKGAVRALIETFVAKAREQGLPVWLEAGNERARDVYGWCGGFKVIGMVDSGVGLVDLRGEECEGDREKAVGIRTWFMVSNWPVERQEVEEGSK